MASINGILNTARTGLIAQQRAIDVTAVNIANANTDGYTRQRVSFQTGASVYSSGITFGTGVQINRNVERVYDEFLDARITAARADAGYWDSQLETLKKTEMIFGETTGYGLNSAMTDFWNAWQELSNNPSGYVERAMLLGESQRLAETFNNLSSGLKQIQKDSDTNIVHTVADINAITAEIADLNEKIVGIEVSGQSANTFRDQRDRRLQELSGLIGISSFEAANGSITVSLPNGGYSLVEGFNSWALQTERNPTTEYHDVQWVSRNGTATTVTDLISNGQLKGWIDARDTTIQGYADDLDAMAVAIRDAVNNRHRTGTDLDSGSGNVFFSGTDASTLAVAIDDVRKIAAAGPGEAVPGGSQNAINIANLQNARLSIGTNTVTANDFYNALVNRVANDVLGAENSRSYQSGIALQLSSYREEISGVSMDDEMIDLVQFQNAYNASAKMVTVVDEMLQTLINMV
ncbi:flagellar hook-associated protein FlgK [Desulfosarcina sp. OttesenSCG-928-G10]|nr:flagellar hook-associated protein FlgK [Desulfosarcina sp. OttesenSCG-928-G10]